jgi:hypothetical protein
MRTGPGEIRTLHSMNLATARQPLTPNAANVT